MDSDLLLDFANSIDPSIIPGYAILDHTPHPKQVSFHNSPAKFRAFIGGRGSGKSEAGCCEVLKFCLDNPGCYGVVAAPTYPMLRDATRRTFLEIADKYVVEFFHGENRAVLENGSEIIFRSLDDPDRAGRGPNFHFAYIDEAGKVSKRAFQILVAAVRRGDNPKIWITTTPTGYNWIYQFWVESKNEGRFYVHATPYDNPGASAEFIASIEEIYTGAFAAQEIRGEFVGFEGLVYPEFSTNTHIFTDVDVPEFKEVVAGVDWGHTNPAVILPIGVDYDGRMWILDEVYERRLTSLELVSLAKQMASQYNIERFYADPSSPDYIRTFNDAGLPCWEAIRKGEARAVLGGISMVASRLKSQEDGKPRLMVHERCRNMINEFQSYRYPEAKEDKPVQDNPLKVFDHALDACRYVVISLDDHVEMEFVRGLPEFDFQ